MPRKSRQPTQGRAPSQRQLRVGELIRHAVSDMLLRGDIHDDVLTRATITIPEVRCSPDLKNATVYVMPLGGKDVDAVIAALNRHAKFIRASVARTVDLKYAPDLRYKADQSFDEAQRIDQILASPQVQRDLTGDE